MSELLMDLADCGSPERLIQAILKHHPDWRPPVPIEELAAAVNISSIEALDTQGFEGALVTNPGKTTGVIFHRAGSPDGRRRFTIGHELGHFLIPTHTGDQRCKSRDMNQGAPSTPAQRKEYEANRFAAGVLMPKPWFMAALDRLGEPEVGHVLELSRLYKTSFEATVNRYVELCDSPCAFVFSFDGKVRYTRKHPRFPTLNVLSGQALPSESATTLKPPTLLRTASSWSEVAGGTWLHSEWGAATPDLLEQSLRQANGYQVTLLILQDIMTDDEEDEGDDRWSSPSF